jgi:hypothetical protein
MIHQVLCMGVYRDAIARQEFGGSLFADQARVFPTQATILKFQSQDCGQGTG